MAPHSITLAWKIPWMEEPGGPQSMGSLTVRHDWATSLSRTGEGNGNPLQCSSLENPRDGAASWSAVYGVTQSRTQLNRLSSNTQNSIEYSSWQMANSNQLSFTLLLFFSHSVMADYLQSHGRQHARLPCPSPSPRPCSNSSTELIMPSNHLILCLPLLLLPSIFPSILVFSNKLVLHIRWPRYWSLSISLSNE